MAYENGYEVIEYIGDVIERYREDNTIFLKALSLIHVFSSRPDWPYCFDDLDKSISNILGQSLSGLIFGFTQRYLYDENMIWPNDLPGSFREELEAFHLAAGHLVNQFYLGRIMPSKLYSVAESNDGSGNNRSLRFIRYDGEYLDFTMDDNDLRYLIQTLTGVLERRD